MRHLRKFNENKKDVVSYLEESNDILDEIPYIFSDILDDGHKLYINRNLVSYNSKFHVKLYKVDIDQENIDWDISVKINMKNSNTYNFRTNLNEFIKIMKQIDNISNRYYGLGWEITDSHFDFGDNHGQVTFNINRRSKYDINRDGNLGIYRDRIKKICSKFDMDFNYFNHGGRDSKNNEIINVICYPIKDIDRDEFDVDEFIKYINDQDGIYCPDHIIENSIVENGDKFKITLYLLMSDID